MTSHGRSMTGAMILLLVAAWLGPWASSSPASAGMRVAPDDSLLISPDTNARAELVGLYAASGWHTEDAVEIVKRAFYRLEGHRVSPFAPKHPTQPDALLLCPDSNLHALLIDLFAASGYSMDDATLHAANAVRRTRGLEAFESRHAMANSTTECAVYRVRLVRCVDGQRTRTTQFVHELCWDQVAGRIEAIPACPSGEVTWGEVRLNRGPSACAFATALPDPNMAGGGPDVIWVDCAWDSWNCDDFDLSERSFDARCGPETACDGCPSCS